MRIVQLANFHTPTSGGLRTVLHELGRRYVQAGHAVYRIVPGSDDAVVDVDGVNEIRLRAGLIPGGSGYRMITDRARVNELLRRVRPDAIELSDKTTLVGPAARRRRIGARVVAISHERIDGILAGRVPSSVPLHRLADFRNKQVAAACDAVVGASRFAVAEFHRIGAVAVHRVPLGVDLDVFAPTRRSEQTAATPIRLVSVGRLSEEKRPGDAIEVVRHLLATGRPTTLTMVGDGPLAHQLRHQARDLPVHFSGHIHSLPELARLLGGADVCIAPCPVETFGLSALEALACGTPIVVPSDGALGELVASEPLAGQVVHDIEWARGGAAKVVELVEHGAIARRGARRRAEQFTWESAVNTMLALMRPDDADRLDEPTVETLRESNCLASAR